VKPRTSAAATTEPCDRTARSDCSATRSIMQRCYIVRCIIIRWYFTVVGANMGP